MEDSEECFLEKKGDYIMKNRIEVLDMLIDKATNIIRNLEKNKNPELAEDIHNKQLALAVLEGERLAVGLREAMITQTIEDKPTLMKCISKVNGFYVYKDGKDVVIELPALPICRYSMYINKLVVDPLRYGLEEFIRNTGHKSFEYGKVEVIHVRPEDTPIRRLSNLHDSEVINILDTVAHYLFVGKSMQNFQYSHMSTLGDETWTQIRVSPLDGDFRTPLKRIGPDEEDT